MRPEIFALERGQSLYEHVVGLNLSESGVHPLNARELFSQEEREELLDERLFYTQTNGTPELRERVAALHPGAGAEDVLITTGGAEANYLATWALIEPGDEAVFLVPNYLQLPGLVRTFGGVVRPWELVPDFEAGRWQLDPDALERAVGPNTKLISITNPNNPTGARLSAEALEAVLAIAERHGLWVHADEIYRGAELDGEETATIFGRAERVVVTGSLSKAYGLPGLRLGWAVSNPSMAEALWSCKDYTTIGPAALSDLCARRALEPERRAWILDRTRERLIENRAFFGDWVEGVEGGVRWCPPEAGAIAFFQTERAADSVAFVERARVEEDLLLCPGAHFGLEGWLRVGLGSPREELAEGLERLGRLLA